MTARRPAGDWPELMTAAEVAAVFRVDPKTVTAWAKGGKLPSVRTPAGGRRLFPEPAVRALLDEQAATS